MPGAKSEDDPHEYYLMSPSKEAKTARVYINRDKSNLGACKRQYIVSKTDLDHKMWSSGI